jgi:integrase
LSESVAANQRATEGEIATPLFSDFPDQWFQESKIQWRSSHTRNVVSILDSSLKPAFKNTQIAEITKADILAARTKMAKRRGRGRGASGLMAPKTINSHLTILRMIMAEASERFEFDNPYRNIKPLKLQKVHFR